MLKTKFLDTFDLTGRKWRPDARASFAPLGRKCCVDSSANSVRKEKNRKNTREGKKHWNSSIGWVRKDFTNYPDRRKSPAGEAKVLRAGNRLYFSLWSLFLAVDVSRWRCCRPIVETHVPEVCVKPPRFQRRRFFPTRSVFFYRFSPFLFYFSRP